MKTMKIAPSFLFSTFLPLVMLSSAGTPVLAAAGAVPMVQADPGGTVTPPSTSIELKPGESQSISFTLTTAELPPQKVDILFLF